MGNVNGVDKIGSWFYKGMTRVGLVMVMDERFIVRG